MFMFPICAQRQQKTVPSHLTSSQKAETGKHTPLSMSTTSLGSQEAAISVYPTISEKSMVTSGISSRIGDSPRSRRGITCTGSMLVKSFLACDKQEESTLPQGTALRHPVCLSGKWPSGGQTGDNARWLCASHQPPGLLAENELATIIVCACIIPAAWPAGTMRIWQASLCECVSVHAYREKEPLFCISKYLGIIMIYLLL